MERVILRGAEVLPVECRARSTESSGLGSSVLQVVKVLGCSHHDCTRGEIHYDQVGVLEFDSQRSTSKVQMREWG